MQDVDSLVKSLKRPKLLVAAARAAYADYRSSASLTRLMKGAVPSKRSAILLRLLDLEAQQNARRKASDASYRIPKHIEILAALLVEADRRFQDKTRQA